MFMYWLVLYAIVDNIISCYLGYKFIYTIFYLKAMPSLIELRAECVKCGLPKGGNKPDLVKRLQAYQVRRAASSSCAAATEVASSSCDAKEKEAASSSCGAKEKENETSARSSQEVAADAEHFHLRRLASHIKLAEKMQLDGDEAGAMKMLAVIANARAEFAASHEKEKEKEKEKADSYRENVKKQGYRGIAALKGAFVDVDMAGKKEKKEEQEGKENPERDGQKEKEEEQEDEEEDESVSSDDDTMEIFVKIHHMSRTITLNVEASESIKNVKAMICNATGIPRKEQRLNFANNELDDGTSLMRNNIQKGDTIALVLLKKQQDCL